MIENPNVICNDCGYYKCNRKLINLLKKCYEYLSGNKDLTMGKLTALCMEIEEVING